MHRRNLCLSHPFFAKQFLARANGTHCPKPVVSAYMSPVARYQTLIGLLLIPHLAAPHSARVARPLLHFSHCFTFQTPQTHIHVANKRRSIYLYIPLMFPIIQPSLGIFTTFQSLLNSVHTFTGTTTANRLRPYMCHSSKCTGRPNSLIHLVCLLQPPLHFAIAIVTVTLTLTLTITQTLHVCHC